MKSSRIDIIDILLKGGCNIDIQERVSSTMTSSIITIALICGIMVYMYMYICMYIYTSSSYVDLEMVGSVPLVPCGGSLSTRLCTFMYIYMYTGISNISNQSIYMYIHIACYHHPYIYRLGKVSHYTYVHSTFYNYISVHECTVTKKLPLFHHSSLCLW